MVRAQAEIELKANANAVKNPARMNIEKGTRRQWGPAAIIAGGAPDDP